MKNITSLKALPIIAALTVGFALTPITAMAGNGERGHHKSEYSRSSGKHHDKGHYRRDKHANRSHGSHQSRSIGRHYNKHRDNHYTGHHDYRRYNYGHHYPRRGHNTTHYVVNDYGHRGHYSGFDQLRFMIGLHTDNVDISFHD